MEREAARLSVSSAQVDLACEHGDHQNDGEAGEQPRVLDQEENDLGGRSFLLPCDAVHLWKLRGRTTVVHLSRVQTSRNTAE